MSVSVNQAVAGGTQTFSRVSKEITFTGAAGLGAVGNGTIFTVTGEVLLFKLSSICTSTLVGATATISMGHAASTAFLTAVTTATTITTGLFWVSSTPTANMINTPNIFSLGGVVATDDVTFTVAVAAVTGGSVRFDFYYLPLSSDGMMS